MKQKKISKAAVPVKDMIRTARNEKGMSQYELAKKLGVTPLSVLKWESGRFAPRLEMAKKINKVLGIKL